MNLHEIKIREEFADAVLRGEKNFEIRENDRGYQKGDLVRFKVVDKTGERKFYHTLNDVFFEITYVLSGWGLKENYVVFGIKRREKADDN